jgi:hypothetical protein
LVPSDSSSVERDEDAALLGGDMQQHVVGRAGEMLVTGERDIVSTVAEDCGNAVGDVLVQLDGGHG